MASKEPEDPSNTTAETDEETVAQRRKRLRRVSFADREITSVHIFNRDEDYETPPNSSASKPQNGEQPGAVESENKVIRFFGDLADSEDSRELLCSSPDDDEGGDAEDEVVGGKLFLRPKGSPSSGGSTVGSATSNDEHNFFGPVSAHFIRPGRLSDSAVSEENHDITMDSTAFSMHFRSLVMSEPGDLKTPTGTHLAVEEKTPSQVTSRSDAGGIMVLTKAKKLFPKSPLPVDKVSGGRDSNDMSLVGDNSHKYDYGRISPALEALLADGSVDLLPASRDNNIKARSLENDLSLSPQNGTSSMHQRSKEKYDAYGIDSCQIQTRDGHPLIKQQEAGSQHHAKPQQEHDPAKDRRQISSVNQIFSQQSQSPQGSSLSSSSIRGQEINLFAPDVHQSLSYVTPSPKQHGSFLTRKTLTLVQNLSSIQKSESRFGVVKTSSPASALLERIEKSKLILSGYRSITTPSNSGRQETSKGLQEKYADVPMTNLEEELSKAENETSAYESEGIIGQGNAGILTPVIGIHDLSAEDQSLKDVFAHIVQGEHNKSPTKASLLKQQEANCSVAKNPTQETVVKRELIEYCSLSREITFDGRNEKQTASTPAKFVSSPANRSNVVMPSSEDYGNLYWQDQSSKSISKSGTEDGNLIDNSASGDSMTVVPKKLDSLPVESGLLLTETSFSNGSAQLKRKNTPLNEFQNTIKCIGNSCSPLKTRSHPKSQSGGPGKDLHIATDVICSNEEFPAEVMANVSGISASPSIDRSKHAVSLVKQKQSTPSTEPTKSPSSLKRLTRSASKKELNNALHKAKLQVAGADLPSLNASLNGFIDNAHSQASVLALSQISEQDTENFTRLKRKTADINHSVGNSGERRSPKVRKSTQRILESVSDDPYENNDANKTIGVCDQIVNWTGIPRKVSMEADQLLVPWADKLNSRLIGKLEDILTHLKKVNLCEMLCLQIQTQKVYDELSGVKTKRCAESRSLLCRIAYEKAKLQLLQQKQEILQKRVQAVSSRIHTSKILRLSYAKLLCQHSEGDGEVKSGCHSTGLVNPEQAHEVTTDKVSEITQEFKALDSKIENLTKSFHICYKMKGEPSYVETIAILKDHLKEKMRCRLIRQDMQLWKVDGLNHKKDDHNVDLNYSGFINQRLTLEPGPVSSVIVSNKLNSTVIKKYFPDMDASIALLSLFSTGYTRKYVASKTLADETQTIGLILGNLLDVAEELQLARMELYNLVQANFNSQSAEQLHLQISFINRRSCRKVIIILDMMCLTRGIYPADIIPCKLLQANTTGEESSLPESLLTKINSAISGLGVGYPRILRLCQCVSRVLRS